MAAEGWLPKIVVEVTGNIEELIGSIEEAKGLLEDFSNTQANARLGGDVTPLLFAIANAKTQMAGFAAEDVRAKLSLDIADVLTYEDMATTLLSQWANTVATAKLSLDISEVLTYEDLATTILVGYADSRYQAKLGLSLEQLTEDEAQAIGDLNTYSQITAEAKLGADLTPLQEALATAYALLTDYGDTIAVAKLDVNTTGATRKVNNLQMKLLDLVTTPWTTEVTVDTNVNAADIAAIRTALAAIPDDTNTQLGGSDTLLIRKIAQAQVALATFATQVSNSRLGADSAPFWEAITELKLALAADPATLTVKGDINPILAQIAALKGKLALARIPLMTQQPSSGVTVLSPADAAKQASMAAERDAVLAAAAGSDGGGGGGGLAGLLAGLGWGKGGNLGIGWLGVPAMAGFGTVAGMAGFGAEHLLMTGVGLAGSAVGAGLGGLALGGTALGVAGVGAATDLAGIGQAIGDAKTYTADMNALNKAIAVYGANSTEAAAATYQLKTDMAGLSPAALSAVKALSAAGQAFHTAFDTATSPAEAIGGQLAAQALGVAQQFLPALGKYAAENMTTIKNGLQPLFTWLDSQSGGMHVFNVLEQQFQKTLPAAIGAFTNAFELIGRTMAYLAPETGKFIETLDRFFTKENTTGFDKWIGDVQRLVNLFHTWEDFVKLLVEDVAKIFSLTAGLGGSIIGQLTGYLAQLHGALSTTSKNSSLGDMFRLHKQEVLQLIQAVEMVGGALGKVYIQAAPAFIKLATLILDVINDFLKLTQVKFLDIGPITGFIVGAGILASRLGILGPLFVGVSGKASLFQHAIDLLGRVTGIQALTSGFSDFFTGSGEGINRTQGLFERLGNEISGMAQSGKKALSDLWSTLRERSGSDAGFLTMPDMSGIKAKMQEAGQAVLQFGRNVMTAAKEALVGLGEMAAGFLGIEVESETLNAILGASVIGAFLLLGAAIYEMTKHFGVLRTAMAVGVVAVLALTAAFWLMEDVPIVAVIAAIGVAVIGLVAAIVYLVTHWSQVWAEVKSIFDDAVNFLRSGFGTFVVLLTGPLAPLLLLALHWQQVWADIKAVATDAWHFLDDAWHDILSDVETILSPTALLRIGIHFVEGLAKGILSAIDYVIDAAKHLASSVVHSIASFLGIASPSTITTGYGQMMGVGLTQGLQSSTGQAVGAASAMAHQITAALGSLTQTGAIASSVSNISRIFSNLASVFHSISSAAATSHSVGSDLAQITLALHSLDGAMSSGLVSQLGNVDKAFSSLAQGGDLKTITTEIGNLGRLFNVIGSTAQSASKVTIGSLNSTETALTNLTQAAPSLVTGIGNMAQAFFEFANSCTGSGVTVNTQLGNIKTTLDKVGSVFTAFGQMASGSSKISALGVLSILSSLHILDQFLPQLMADLNTTTADMAKFHDWKQLFGDLNNLITLFGKIGQVFGEISKDASSADGMTAPALADIVTAVGKVGSSLSSLPTAIFVANGPVVSTLQALVNNMLATLTSGPTLARFTSAGENMMQGLSAGINQAAGSAAQAAAQAATNALNAAKSATKTSSPSLLYTELGENWMLGLINGISNKARNVQSALTGSLPTVGHGSLAPLTGSGTTMNVTAHFNINAPGGNPTAIQSAIETDSAKQFAKASLTAMKAGAGQVY